MEGFLCTSPILRDQRKGKMEILAVGCKVAYVRDMRDWKSKTSEAPLASLRVREGQTVAGLTGKLYGCLNMQGC
jgi:hypothetical protein